MATSTSFQTSTNENQSTSTPTVTPTPQSNWSLALSQLLAQLGQTEQAWAMQEYARAGQVTDAQINNYIAQAQQGNELATGLMNRYQNIYGPAEDQYALNAQSYDSPGRISNEMGAAEGRAMMAGKQASDNAERELQAFGIDPSSGRYQDLIRASRTADAASAAAAGETARRATEMEGTRRREQAIAMGQQLPGASVNAMNSAYQGIAGAANTALALANTGANLTTASSKFFDPATHMIQPLQGQNSQSTGRGNSVGGSNSSSPSGGGGGGSRTSDPFNSDRFGRGSGAPPLNSGAGRGMPEHNIPNQVFRPNPNANIRPVNQYGQDQWYGLQPGLEAEGMQGYGGPDPWNGWSAQQDPYSWGGQGGAGIVPNDIRLTGNDPWGQTPSAPDWWNTGSNGEPTVDGSAGDGWWNQGGQNAQSQFPDPTMPDWYSPNYGQFSDQSGGQDYSVNTDLGNTGQWTGGYNQGEDWTGTTQQDYGGGGASDWGDWGDWTGGGGSYSDPSYYDTGYNEGGDFYAKGGVVGRGRPQRGQRPSQGGGYIPPQMSPSRGRVTDDIPGVIPQSGGQVRVNAGEFVIPRDVVEWKGKEFFQKMTDQVRKRGGGVAPQKPRGY